MLRSFTRTVLLCAAVAFSGLIFAQKGDFSIRGIITDADSAEPIEYATVMVADKVSQTPLTGATTEADGSFNIQISTQAVYVEVSFIGFATRTIRDISFVDGVANLGTVVLGEDSQVLSEVVVTAEKSTTEFRLDKRVFNVGQDLSTTGASALEVLNNVPSVNVSIEGQISLRGSNGVQILINGKPSVLANDSGSALGTITADMIEKIEVITNPSAKYDAEGTSGIINIVLKKEDRKGVNGSLTVNTGAPHNHSVGLSLNRRSDRFNLFSQFGAGYREVPTQVRNTNTSRINNSVIRSEGEEFRNEYFYNFILGTDYIINKNNIITLSGNVAYEVEDQPSRTNFFALDETGAVTESWFRTENTQATNPKYQYELQYKRDFKDSKDHTLLVSAVGNFFGKDQSSTFDNINLTGNQTPGNQETRTNFNEERHTLNLDYTRPFAEKWTLETGGQYVLNNVNNDFAVTDFIDNAWVPNENLTNIFEYQQNVIAVYGTGAYESDQWGLKLGLRLENTDLSTLLVNTNQANSQNFTNFFPTAHTSYKVTDHFSLQAGYSKRIFRPRMWDLNPFFNIRNNFNIRAGNPDLLPEFTDSYEVSSIHIYDKISFNFGLYYRYTTDVVERITTFEDNVSTTIPLNIGTNRSTGIEVNGKYTASKWLTFQGDFNYNYFSRQGTLEATVFDFAADQWSSKITAKMKLPANFDFEVTGQYQSRLQTIQSVVSDNIFADMGLRKKVWKGRGVFSLSVRDIFASRIQEQITTQSNFETYSWSQRGRFTTLGFSYGFGKGEAMEFSGQRRYY